MLSLIINVCHFAGFSFPKRINLRRFGRCFSCGEESLSGKLYLILGDQLSEDHPFLMKRDWAADENLVMIESVPRMEWLPYHPQKLIYLLVCMRRFSEHIIQNRPKIPFKYIKGSESSIPAVLNSLGCKEIHIVEPSEPRARKWISEGTEARIVFHASPFFLAEDSMLPAKPPYLMENFYRKMRVKFRILMDGDEPAGGQWNFDKDNRLSPDKELERNPPRDFFNDDWLDERDKEIAAEVISMLRKYVPAERFGDWIMPRIPTHAASAKRFLNDFVKNRLSLFGPYEDAMISQSAGLFHSGLSAAMNIQLLSVRQILSAAENADAGVPIASREGFIRQILGWREFVRLVYLRHSGDYSACNFFGFSETLPPLYWGKNTRMNCLGTIVGQIRETAYSHHIPRLMVLGNFALLTHTNPHEVNEWFWSVYLDAYEWVVSPNVLGMSQFADGGVFATKPYVSGANYINKMSNYCKTCKYNPKLTVGEDACPFNSLYWSFIGETQRQQSGRPSFARRMGMMWSVWNKKSDDDKQQIEKQAAKYRQLARNGAI
ncbi:MAG: cryptochrome/photolyase family protein [Proteobacteria bacterium]|nr:cryptochrome/photolyase family protein [Pseudomonadota bacterium]